MPLHFFPELLNHFVNRAEFGGIGIVQYGKYNCFSLATVGGTKSIHICLPPGLSRYLLGKVGEFMPDHTQVVTNPGTIVITGGTPDQIEQFFLYLYNVVIRELLKRQYPDRFPDLGALIHQAQSATIADLDRINPAEVLRDLARIGSGLLRYAATRCCF